MTMDEARRKETLKGMQALWYRQPWYVKLRVKVRVWCWFQKARWKWRWQRCNNVLNFRETIPDGPRPWSPS